MGEEQEARAVCLNDITAATGKGGETYKKSKGSSPHEYEPDGGTGGSEDSRQRFAPSRAA